MASTAELLLRASGATLWLPLPSHSAPYPSSCSEDLGDLLDQLEEIELDHHSKPPRMVTESPPCEISWRALDLKFPLEDMKKAGATGARTMAK